MSMQDVAMQYVPEEGIDEVRQPHLTTNILPSHWKLVSLGEVLREVDIRAEDLKIVESEHSPVLSLTKNNGLIPQYERFNNRVATQDISSYKVIKKGQIVYNPFVIWEGAIYALKGREQGLISPAYLIWETIHANPYFLDFLLRTPLLLNEYLRVASGVVQRRRAVRKDTFLHIRIPLPPLPEQHAIARALQTVQNAIQARRKEIELEREHKAVLMKHLFTHGIRNEPTKQSEIGEMPESWKVCRLQDIAEVAYGLTVNEVRRKGTQLIPYLAVANVTRGALRLDEVKQIGMLEGDAEHYRLQKGDVLLIEGNGNPALLGSAAMWNDELPFALHQNHLIRARPDQNVVLPAWLMGYLNSDNGRSQLLGKAKTSSGLHSINSRLVSNLYIPLPSSFEQREIVAILSACDSKITTLEKELSLHEELFRALLEQLMTGRLSALPLGE